MKKLVMTALSLVAAFAAQAISLSDARAQIAACIAEPNQMTTVMKSLDAGDQVAFLSEVNEAIAAMPGPAEAKAAACLNTNKAALLGAAKGNLTTMVAEVFATVPVEVLPVLSERLAADLFNRSSDPTKVYTDEQFTKISQAVMEKVNTRTASSEDGAVRASFAIVMMVEASNGTPATLSETLIATLPESARETARKEWIPSATGKTADGQTVEQSYEPMLADAETAGELPASAVVLRLAGPQVLQSLLSYVVEGTPLLEANAFYFMNTIEPSDMTANVTPGANRPHNSTTKPIERDPISGDWVVPMPEPEGYQGQW